MLFNSLQFAVFFAVVYGLYRVLGHRWQNRMLLAASYLFYGAWNYKFLSLILLSTVVDYFCGLRMAAAGSRTARRRFLILSISTNLGILGFFKYFNFFADNAATMLLALGVPVNIGLLEIVLPVGISFYTFQTMSYTIDIYREKLKPERNFFDFALFVAYFPQLVAGPIERASRLLPQIKRPRRITTADTQEGVFLVLWGLFKKLVIADNLALIVNSGFGAAGSIASGDALIAVYAFAFQIYCDFSGYSDIARGVSRLLGIKLVLNFNLPYFATGPRDFWRRWHISLSQWLRDYLYIPLGGSRGGAGILAASLMLTMLLGGLWHGAQWTFVVWGGYHGLLLIVSRICAPLTERWAASGSQTVKFLQIVGTFHLVCLGWLIFRAESLAQVVQMIQTISAGTGLSTAGAQWLMHLIGFGGLLLVVQLIQYMRDDLLILLRAPFALRWVGQVALFYGFVLLGSPGGQAFIYFQF